MCWPASRRPKKQEFYEAHVDSVYRLAYRVTRDAELSSDLAGETFIRAFKPGSGQVPGGCVYCDMVAARRDVGGLERTRTNRDSKGSRDLAHDEANMVSSSIHDGFQSS